jgi:putative protein-disulfide isomerase
MQPTILYVQDSLCGWCYVFSPVMEKLYEHYAGRVNFDVLSGGMVPPEHAQPIKAKASYIAEAYKIAEEYSGVKFGEPYLHHILHPAESNWVEESLTPATALCLLKAGDRRHTIGFASAIQRLHMQEGKDLSDGETYRTLAASINLDPDEFIGRLAEEDWQEEARYEFALARQLGISGFPAVLLQAAADKFYLIARGYTSYEDLSARLDRVLAEISSL